MDAINGRNSIAKCVTRNYNYRVASFLETKFSCLNYKITSVLYFFIEKLCLENNNLLQKMLLVHAGPLLKSICQQISYTYMLPFEVKYIHLSYAVLELLHQSLKIILE